MKKIKSAIGTLLASDNSLKGLLGGEKIYFKKVPTNTTMPYVTYMEIMNSVGMVADDQEVASEITIKFDVYSEGTTTDIAIRIDELMRGIGFCRNYAVDVEDDFEMSDVLEYERKTMSYTGMVE